MRKTKLDVEIEKLNQQLAQITTARDILVSVKGPSKPAAKPKKARKEPSPEVAE